MDEELPPPSNPVPVLPSGNDPAQLEAAKGLGWNWGGFFLPYIWLLGHGKLTLGFFLILSMGLPFVILFHLFLYPATAIYLGLNGYELSWREQPYHSVEQLRQREREWTLWGAALKLVCLAFLLFSLIYLRAFVQEVLDALETWAY